MDIEGKCFWMKMVGRVPHGSVLDSIVKCLTNDIHNCRCDAFNLDKYHAYGAEKYLMKWEVRY